MLLNTFSCELFTAVNCSCTNVKYWSTAVAMRTVKDMTITDVNCELVEATPAVNCSSRLVLLFQTLSTNCYHILYPNAADAG